MNHFIVQGLIILILINSISSSTIIKDGFPTTENNSNDFATNEESLDEEGQRPDIGEESLDEEGKKPAIDSVGSKPKEAEPKDPSLLGNNSYNALPFPKFLNYYINKTNAQINGIACLEISKEPNNPETIVKIPCAEIFVFIADKTDKNFTKNYNISPPTKSFFYNDIYNDKLLYQLKLLSTLITETDLDPKNKFSYCGIVKEYVSIRTEIISCTNIGILMR